MLSGSFKIIDLYHLIKTVTFYERATETQTPEIWVKQHDHL